MVEAHICEAAARSVGVIDDPSPDSRPAGVVLPFGVLRFNVDVDKPGGSTAIFLMSFTGDGATQVSSYWKFGPQAFGGPSAWYDFVFDSQTSTGLLPSSALAKASGKLPWEGGSAISALLLTDGARGDSDLAPNGRIVDPGGPVAVTDPATTTTTSTTTTVAATATTTTTVAATATTTGPSSGPANVASVAPVVVPPETAAPTSAPAATPPSATSASTTTKPSTEVAGLALNAPVAPAAINTSAIQAAQPIAYTGSEVATQIAIALAAIALGLLVRRKAKRAR